MVCFISAIQYFIYNTYMSFFFAKGNTMERLEAVNLLLKTIGSTPVNDINSKHPDVSNAKASIKLELERLQRKRWWFNRDFNVSFEPNAESKILIPKQIQTFKPEDGADVTVRGNYLYDRVRNSFLFTSVVVAHEVTRQLEWEDLPDVAQDVIAYRAAITFVRDETGDVFTINEMKEQAGLATLELKERDLRESNLNVFNNSRIERARGGVRPYQKVRGVNFT